MDGALPAHVPDFSANKEKKRTRVQLSCTACRARKLKCCRTHPCTNCSKRGEAHACVYVGRGPRARTSHGRASPSHVQNRLQHLENLVLSFTQKQRLESGGDATVPGVSSNAQLEDDKDESDVSEGTLQVPSSGDEAALHSPQDLSGKLLMKEAGPRYIDGAHWSAILEEIIDVKESLLDNDGAPDEEFDDETRPSPPTPTILFGLNKPASVDELLADIPPRLVANRLLSQFLNSKEPLLTMFHAPTLLKEYNQFWANPRHVFLSWLSMLYSVFTMTIQYSIRLEEPLAISGDTMETLRIFRKRSAQCLAQSNYTVPGPYKVEAMFLYSVGEFFQTEDANAGASFLFSMTIKLAMRMGYHRDARHFPTISNFAGEMRRRVWAILYSLDILTSFQVGLPRTVQDWQCDVDLPRNILDIDFDENTQELPPNRPETEFVAASYIRAKSRLMGAFGKISDLAYSREPVTYEGALELDRRLEEAHDHIPGLLKVRPLNQCIADPADLILRRYTLHILYQKSRCVLHRRYLGEVRNSHRYAYSRWVCMSAAKEILRCQADLYNEAQPGGILNRDKLSLSSLQYHDYLLAAMILCLELSYSQRSVATNPTDATATGVDEREDLLATLETSHEIFDKTRRRSADAQRAYAALSVMLRRVKQGPQNQKPERSLNDDQDVPTLNELDESSASQPPPYGSWSQDNAIFPLDMTTGYMPNQMDEPEHPFYSLAAIEGMLDTPNNLDWRLWDQQIHGFEEPSSNSLWFPPMDSGQQ